MRLSSLKLERPLWVNRDLSQVSTLGAPLPFADIVLVAAFPISVLTPGLDFVVYRDSDEGGKRHRFIVDGRITAQDMKVWR